MEKRLNSWIKPVLTPPEPLSLAWLQGQGTQQIPGFFPEGGSCFLSLYNGQKKKNQTRAQQLEIPAPNATGVLLSTEFLFPASQ